MRQILDATVGIDPLFAVMEVCNLAPEGEIDVLLLYPIIYILSSENLISHKDSLGDYGIRNNRLESVRTKERILDNLEKEGYVEYRHTPIDILITNRGRNALLAMGISESDSARNRIAVLLKLKREHVEALAWKYLADRILSN